MRPGWRQRIRRLATAVAFVAGVVATAATSPAYTTIDIPAAHATLLLDQDRPAALTRIVITLNAEATSTYSGPQFQLFVDANQPVAPRASGSSSVTEPRFIVTSTPPGEADSSESWEEEVRGSTPATLRIDCGIGPCERTFWFIAALEGPDAPAFEIDWHVAGHLNFSGSAWPTGAGGSISIDPPTYVEGPIPDLVAATESEVVQLGPQRPAAARVIEVRIGADAIPDDQGMVESVPFALLSIDLSRRPDSGGEPERSPLVKVFPLDGAALVDNPDGPLPTPIEVAREADAFTDCEPRVDCVRRFLVTFEWTGAAGEDEAYDWGVRVRRLDLVGAWSSPADLSVSVERRFDVGPDMGRSVAHFEGEATTSESGLPPQVQIELATQTTAADPIFRLLPAPAVMTYRANTRGGDPRATGGGPTVTAVVTPTGWENGGMTQINASSGDGVLVTTNPLAGCPVGDACASLTVSTVAQRTGYDVPRPTVPYAWRLDVTLYSFAEAPLTLTALDHSP